MLSHIRLLGYFLNFSIGALLPIPISFFSIYVLTVIIWMFFFDLNFHAQETYFVVVDEFSFCITRNILHENFFCEVLWYLLFLFQGQILWSFKFWII